MPRLARRPTAATVFLGGCALLWLLFWMYRAQGLWRQDLVCVLGAGPFLPCGPGPLAWRQPAAMALVPAAVLCIAWLLRRIARPRRAP